MRAPRPCASAKYADSNDWQVTSLYAPRLAFVVALICRSYPFGVVVW
jgi:hypothetical protein